MEQQKPKNHQMEIIPLRERPELCRPAAAWFSGKWGIPEEEYRQSMRDMLRGTTAVPQWYVTLGGQGEIIAGAGVIDNDFHNRKDLSPNLCALFVEPACRRQGLARKLLRFIQKDMGGFGVPRLYLVTDHTSFYEKCGWRFVTMAVEDDGRSIRLYEAPAFFT